MGSVPEGGGQSLRASLALPKAHGEETVSRPPGESHRKSLCDTALHWRARVKAGEQGRGTRPGCVWVCMHACGYALEGTCTT